MDSPFKIPVSVLVVIHTVDGQVLMLSRVHPSGFWQSVTGSLEPGETPQDAARRELFEETGIDATPVDRGRYVDFPISERWLPRYAPEVTTNREHEFSLRLAHELPVRLDPAEHVAARWVPRSEALELAFSPTNRAAIRRWVHAG